MKEKSKTVEVWETLKEINFDKEKINIFCDPKTFFGRYIDKITDDTIKKTIKTEIYLMLRKVSKETNTLEGDEEINKRCKDDLEFIHICRGFYAYTLDMLLNILAEQSDAILDSYNEKKISKDCMENYLKAFQKSQALMLMEKRQLEQRIMELDILLEEIEKNPNLPDDFRNSY